MSGRSKIYTRTENSLIVHFPDTNITIDNPFEIEIERKHSGVTTSFARVQNTARLLSPLACYNLVNSGKVSLSDLFPGVDLKSNQVSQFLSTFEAFSSKPYTADIRTSFYHFLCRNLALHRDFYKYYTSEQSVDLLIEEFYNLMLEENMQNSRGAITLLKRDYRALLIDFNIFSNGYNSSDRIIFYNPASMVPVSYYYLPHPSFSYYVDFNVNQSTPMENAALVLGASIKDHKLVKGTHFLSYCNMRPMIFSIDPVRLATISSGGIRRRDVLVSPRTPVIKSIESPISDVTTARIAFMDFFGYTHQEGIVISESFSKRLITLRTETRNFWWCQHPDSDYHITKVVDNVLNGDPQFVSNKTLLVQEIDSVTGEPVKNFVLRTKWQVLGGKIEAIEINKTPGLPEKDYIRALIGVLDYIPDEKKDLIISLIRILQSSNIDNYGKIVSQFTQKHNLDYINFMIGNNIVVEMKVVVNWAVKATVGTKLTTLQGWKGCITAIMPDEYMPRTPSGDPVEVIISPMKLRKRNIVSSMITEAAIGRLGGIECSCTEDLYDYAVNKFNQLGYDTEGDYLKITSTVNHFLNIRSYVNKLINDKTLPKDSISLLQKWLLDNPERENSHESNFTFTLPFKTFWGIITLTKCNGDPAVNCVSEVFDTGKGVSVSRGAVKIGYQEATELENGAPNVANWIRSSLPKGRTLARKIRRAMVDQTLIDDSADEIRKVIPLPENLFESCYKDNPSFSNPEKAYEALLSAISAFIPRRADFLETINPVFMWTFMDPGNKAVLIDYDQSTGSISNYRVSATQHLNTAAEFIKKLNEVNPPRVYQSPDSTFDFSSIGWKMIEMNTWIKPISKNSDGTFTCIYTKVLPCRTLSDLFRTTVSEAS